MNQRCLACLEESPFGEMGKWEREEIEDDTVEGSGSINLEGKQQNNGFFHRVAIQRREVKKDCRTLS